MDVLISTVNDADLGWKADVCKYQKHHAKYGAHCEKEKLMLAQTKMRDVDLEQVAEELEEGDSKTKFGVPGDKKFEGSL